MMRRDFLQGETVRTLYLGGGTPSQLRENDFKQIFSTLNSVYGLGQCLEITIEANPDDLTDEYLSMLSSFPFNRISMGVQTFDDSKLKMLNRRHTAKEAIEAVHRCRRHGFSNISIDLIYGLPGETQEQWGNDLDTAIGLDVEHISAYHLTYEEGTPLFRMVSRGEVSPVSEEFSVSFFKTLREKLLKSGYEHYEISNFCRPGKQSCHNSSYWQSIPYLGCGPSAHSFYGNCREWNVRSLQDYILSLERGELLFEKEVLDNNAQYDEFVMTRLRTCKGMNLIEIENKWGKSMHSYCLKMAEKYLSTGMLALNDNILKLTPDGILVSDGIITDLMAD